MFRGSTSLLLPSRILICVLVVMVLGTCECFAQTALSLIDGSDIESNLCYTTTGSLRISKTSLSTQPSAPIQVYDLGYGPKVTIDCIDVLEKALFVEPSDGRCSLRRSTISLCYSDTNSASRTQCEELGSYLVNVRTKTERGALDGDSRHWTLQWNGGQKDAACYPRDVQLVAIAKIDHEVNGSVALLIVMGIIIGIVVVIVVAFAIIQLRRHATRHERMESRPVSSNKEGEGEETGEEHHHRAKEKPIELPLRELRLQYYQASGKGGFDPANIDGPLSGHYGSRSNMPPKSPFVDIPPMEGSSFYANPIDNDLGMKETLHSPREGSAPPRDSIIPIPILEAAQHSPRRHAGPMASPQNSVLICRDCGAVIQDEMTSEFCEQTGKRHR